MGNAVDNRQMWIGLIERICSPESKGVLDRKILDNSAKFAELNLLDTVRLVKEVLNEPETVLRLLVSHEKIPHTVCTNPNGDDHDPHIIAAKFNDIVSAALIQHLQEEFRGEDWMAFFDATPTAICLAKTPAAIELTAPAAACLADKLGVTGSVTSLEPAGIG